MARGDVLVTGITDGPTDDTVTLPDGTVVQCHPLVTPTKEQMGWAPTVPVGWCSTCGYAYDVCGCATDDHRAMLVTESNGEWIPRTFHNDFQLMAFYQCCAEFGFPTELISTTVGERYTTWVIRFRST